MKCSIRLRASAALAMLVIATPSLAQQGGVPAAVLDRTVLPIPAKPFSGTMAKTYDAARPDRPSKVTAPAGAPNVLIVMTDDVGFGASSTFGGPIPTPNLDRLARQGLRYTRFHTTGVCSPSRAALLTGRNHHSVGWGELVNTPFPGYNGHIPASAATIGRILGENGYSTAFWGKHHNVPADEQAGTGPFDQWPTGLGFDYFYGFIGEIDQWHPRLYRGTTPTDEPQESSELLDERMTDDAIRWVHNQNAATPDKPFLMYYATGAGHSPHQAPAQLIERFKGKFDQGWDKLREETFRHQKAQGIIPSSAKLTPRPEQIPAWGSLSPEMRRVHARYMEVYAAAVNYFDQQFGRLTEELDRMGLLENTLIVFVQGDNGGTAQNGIIAAENGVGAITGPQLQTEAELLERLPLTGGPETYQSFSVGWSYALNSPFPWFKHIASHLGATRNGMVMAWPAGIKEHGEIRTTFSHLNDILPTVLDAAHIPAPVRVDGVEQQPMAGSSLIPSFSNAAAEPHRTQYFELSGERAIYHEGWFASSAPHRMPWERGAGANIAVPEFTELYDLRNDFSQAVNLAQKEPKRLQELAGLWDAEAQRNNVYPIDPRPGGIKAAAYGERGGPGRSEFVYWGGDVSVPSGPPIGASSFTLVADIIVPAVGATGPIVATGGRQRGWAFYLKNGRPTVYHAFSHLPRHKFSVSASEELKPGPASITYRFTRQGSGGEMLILANGKEIGRGRLDQVTSGTLGLGETFDIGRDTGVKVTDDYPNDRFPGTITKAVVSLARERRAN